MLALQDMASLGCAGASVYDKLIGGWTHNVKIATALILNLCDDGSVPCLHQTVQLK